MARVNKTKSTEITENVNVPTQDPTVQTIETPVEETTSTESEPTVVSVPTNVLHVDVSRPLNDELEEQLRLAKELNLTIRTNPQTGKPNLPSTPAMRAAAARLAIKPTIPNKTKDIEKLVEENHGEKALNDPNIQLVISTMSEYVKLMGPDSVIDEDAGGAAQAKLANLYDIVLNLEPNVADIALKIIVTIVTQNINGAFRPTLALRFANTMPLNSELSIRFQLLTTLFTALASGVTKKDLGNTINLRQLLEYVSDRNAKANLSEFIN